MAKNPEQSHDNPVTLVADQGNSPWRHLPSEARQRYEDVMRDARYQHFVRIAPRILRCLDYFGIEFDRALVRDRLLAYYLFIGVIDEALDFRNLNIGKTILKRFDSPACRFDELAGPSTLEIVTDVLKHHTTPENHVLIYVKLAELYREVVREQAATSIDDYIRRRKTIGSRTAELSFILIQDLLRGDTVALCQLMKQVGKVGCLVDSVIDLQIDSGLGLLSFKPSPMDRVRLTACALLEGVHTLLRYPRLTNLFAEAIVDNIRDRFRAEGAESPLLITDRKDEVAGVI